MVPPSSPYWSQRLGSYPKFVFSVHSALTQSWISISSSFHIHPVPPFSFVAQSCSTLCDPMNCSMPGFPVLHHLPELAQTHIHWVNDAIQPSHSLSSPSPAFNLSQPQGLFQWVGSSHQVAKVLKPQHQSLQAYSGLISFRIDIFDPPCCPRDSQESSTSQFKRSNSLAFSLLYGSTLTSIHDYWKNHQFSSVTQSYPTLCNPMDCNMPGFPVHHQLLEPTQTHVHRVSDAIQPSHSLSSPSPPTFNLSQNQGLFQ